MPDLKTLINSIGLLLTLVGIWILFVNSPLNIFMIDGGSANTDLKAIERETDRRNFKMKVAVYMLLAGGTIQLVSNFIPSK